MVRRTPSTSTPCDGVGSSAAQMQVSTPLSEMNVDTSAGTGTMPEIATYSIFIDGEWRAARSGEVFESENPYTGEPWCTIPRCLREDADDAVQAAARAFRGPAWRGHVSGTQTPLPARMRS